MYFFLISLVSFFTFYKHFLVTLIILEFISLSLCLTLGMMSDLQLSIEFFLFFSCFMVIEGLLGLVILVEMNRIYGMEMSLLISIMEW